MSDVILPVANPEVARTFQTPTQLLERAPRLHDRDAQSSWANWLGRSGLPLEGGVNGGRFPSTGMLVQAAVAGLGVAMVRRRLVASELEAGALVPLGGLAEQDIGESYWLIAASRLRPGETLFVDWLRRAARDA